MNKDNVIDGCDNRFAAKPAAQNRVCGVQVIIICSCNIFNFFIFIVNIGCCLAKDHHFMIAKQQMNPSSAFPGLLFQSEKVPEYFRYLTAPVKNIPKNHQVAFAEFPAHILINNTIFLQQPGIYIILPVNVTYQGYAVDIPVILSEYGGDQKGIKKIIKIV